MPFKQLNHFTARLASTPRKVPLFLSWMGFWIFMVWGLFEIDLKGQGAYLSLVALACCLVPLAICLKEAWKLVHSTLVTSLVVWCGVPGVLLDLLDAPGMYCLAVPLAVLFYFRCSRGTYIPGVHLHHFNPFYYAQKRINAKGQAAAGGNKVMFNDNPHSYMDVDHMMPKPENLSSVSGVYFWGGD